MLCATERPMPQRVEVRRETFIARVRIKDWKLRGMFETPSGLRTRAEKRCLRAFSRLIQRQLRKHDAVFVKTLEIKGLPVWLKLLDFPMPRP